MANITESPTYDAAVPQLETSTPAIGGAGGAMNSQAQALANRTKYLKDALDSPSGMAARIQDAATGTAEVTAAPAHWWVLAGGALKRMTHAGWTALVHAALPGAIEGGTATATPLDTDIVPSVKADHSRLYYTWANIVIWLKTLLTKRTKMPDGATAVYSNDAFDTGHGWTADGAMDMLATDGTLRMTRKASGGTGAGGLLRLIAGINAKTLFVKYRYSSIVAADMAPVTVNGYVAALGNTFYTLPLSTEWVTVAICIPVNGVTPINGLYFRSASGLAAAWFEIDSIWIGDYSYLTGSLSEEAARIADQLGDTPGVGAAATATITASDVATATKGDTIHGKKYTFVAALTASPGVEGEVLKGATKEDDLENLNLAISEAARTNNGVKYWAAAVHPTVSSSRTNAVLALTAKTPGLQGSSITVVCESGTNHVALNPAGGSTTLAGGVDDAGAKVKSQLGPAIGAGATPGAMPTRTATSIIGYRGVADCASGAQVTLPAGGTWLWRVGTYGATYNSLKAGTAAGGLMSGTASANLTMFYERVA